MKNYNFNVILFLGVVSIIAFHKVSAQNYKDWSLAKQLDSLIERNSLCKKQTQLAYKHLLKTSGDKIMRIKAESHYVFEVDKAYLNDTSVFYYSGNRGYKKLISNTDPNPFFLDYHFDSANQKKRLHTSKDNDSKIRFKYNSVDLPTWGQEETTFDGGKPLLMTYNLDYTPELWLKNYESKMKYPSFENGAKYSRVYDVKGNTTELNEFVWDDLSKTWEYATKTIYKYDSTKSGIQLLTQTTSQIWLDTSKALRNNQQNFWQYDSTGKLIYSLSQSWDTISNKWINVQMDSLIYNTIGQNISTISFLWNELENSWFANAISIQTFDAFNNLATTNKRVKSDDTFRNSDLIIYTFDKDKLLSRIDLKWNILSFSYDTLKYYEAVYNARNLLTSQSTRYYPVTVGGITVYYNSRKYDYEYDALDNTISFTSYNGDYKGNWTKEAKSFYYYDIIDLNINNNEVIRHQLFSFPNPSNGNITIKNLSSSNIINTEAKIYDLLGHVVFQSHLHFVNNSATLQVQSPIGIYILELSDETGIVKRERIVIE
jgi:hypothetical protein